MSLQPLLQRFTAGYAIGALDAYLRHMPPTVAVKTAAIVGTTLAASAIASAIFLNASLDMSHRLGFSPNSSRKIAAAITFSVEAACLTGLFALNVLSVQSFATLACYNLVNRAFLAYGVQNGSTRIRAVS